MPHDSMVTVRLSEPPPALTLDTSEARLSAIKLTNPPRLSVEEAEAESDSSSGEEHLAGASDARDSIATASPTEASRSLQDELGDFDVSSRKSFSSEEVNWEELEKTEDEQTKDEETDNVRITSHAR